jgi:type IV pilus assembly protein PilV
MSVTRQAQGFTLVEVLVALAVLAVGLLAAALLIVGSQRNTRIALEYTQAVNLAGEMVEFIRANPAAGNAYDTTDGTPDPRVDPACERRDAGCGPAALASHDLARWLESVATSLPGGTGTVEVDPAGTPQQRYSVSVAWSQSAERDRVQHTLVAEL